MSKLPTDAMIEAGRLALMDEREHDRCISLEPAEMRAALTAALAVAPRDEAPPSIDERIGDLVDLLGASCSRAEIEKVDPRAWQQLLIYAPENAVTFSAISGTIIPRVLRIPTDDAFNAGLEEAAAIARDGCLVPPDGGSPTEEERQMCERIAAAIRARKRGAPSEG